MLKSTPQSLSENSLIISEKQELAYRLNSTKDQITVTDQTGTIQAEVQLIRKEGCLFAHLLESAGDPRPLLLLLREIKRLSQQEPIYIHVMYDNPDFERIKKLYETGGATEFALLMKLGE